MNSIVGFERTSTFIESLRTGFMDLSIPSDLSYRPVLVHNNRYSGQRVLSTIRDSLDECVHYDMAVAFISRGGVASLFQALRDADALGKPGRILTTDYLYFNDPEALRTLLDFTSIETRVFHGNFHVKGYLFHNKNHLVDLVVGSANLTETALSVNEEWNLKVSSTIDGSIVRQTTAEFERVWEQATKPDESWLLHYETLWRASRSKGSWIAIPEHTSFAPDCMPFLDKQSVWTRETETSHLSIEPNSMQTEALESLKALRLQGKTKALVVSATGTGKTHLAAFDVKRCRPDRFLYLAHRETILASAIKTFQLVLGNDHPIDFGMFTGDRKDFAADYLFANISTLAKEEHLARFDANHFDYILVDEVHRAGADSYKRVLSRFAPAFLLGMTATPRRTDGQDIHELFDNTIAHSLGLQQALEQDLLCPFHYFGIREITVNGQNIDDSSDFTLLAAEERIRHIKKTLDTYSMHEKRRRGLVFCRRVDEARSIAESLNTLGMRTVAVSGADSEAARMDAVDRLESDTRSDCIDYIVTVDIFNEGIDIPSLNQIVMVRPTQSAIVFVQQLGRGLRKHEGKPYVLVIDFVGNYNNNYLIPIALHGDTNGNKDQIRKLVSSDAQELPGTSTIDFDPVTRERIYHAIDQANLDSMNMLKATYQGIKALLGRIPSLMDIANSGDADPLAFLRAGKTYPQFVQNMEKHSLQEISEVHLKSLQFFSSELADGKRVHEAVLLLHLMEYGHIRVEQYKNILAKTYQATTGEASIASACRVLTPDYQTQQLNKLYGTISYVERSEDLISASKPYSNLLGDPAYRQAATDVLRLALHMNRLRYKTPLLQPNGLVLYEKYTRKDICRLLNWDKNESNTIYGYKIKHNTCPVFVTLHKRADIDAAINYDDRFISPEWFQWMTRNGVSLGSPEPKAIMAQPKTGLDILLFVKKHDDEGKDFHYLGTMDYVHGNQWQETITTAKNTQAPIVRFLFHLHHPIELSLYRYLLHHSEQ